MFGSAEEDGYGEPPVKPNFNQLPHQTFVRIMDKLSSHGVKQKRAILVSDTVVVVCDAHRFRVRRVIRVQDIAGAFKQVDPIHPALGKTRCAVLLCVPSGGSHDLILMQPREKKAGYATMDDMTLFLRAVSQAKANFNQRLPVKTLPAGQAGKAARDSIVNHAFLVKDKTFVSPNESVETILDKYARKTSTVITSPPLPASPDADSDSRTSEDMSPSGRKVSFGGVENRILLDESTDTVAATLPGTDGTGGSASPSSAFSGAGSPAPWQPDDARKKCSVCETRFTQFSRRRHHCRKCGQLVCYRCSPYNQPVAGYSSPVRVCTTCYHESSFDPDHRPAPVPRTITPSQSSRSSVDDDEEGSPPPKRADPSTSTSLNPIPSEPVDTPQPQVTFVFPNDEAEEKKKRQERRRKRREKRRRAERKRAERPAADSGFEMQPWQRPVYVNPHVAKRHADAFWVEFMKEYDISERAASQYDCYRQQAASVLPPRQFTPMC